MKTKSTFAALLLGVLALIPSAWCATTNLTALLQQGLFEEQANRNLDAAIASYQTLATQFDQDRQLAATAVFRLGECYRAQGKTNEAAAQYQRILRDFSDQKTLATLSQQDLAGMGALKAEAPANENPDAKLWNKLKDMPSDDLEKILPTLLPDASLESLLQKRNEARIKLAELKMDWGAESDTVVRQHRTLEQLQKQVDEKISGMMRGLQVRAEIYTPPQTARHDELLTVSLPSEEDQEIERIQKTIQNSPDLINAADNSGVTLLGKAAVAGQFKVVNYLLDHGADINGGLPALYQATGAGNRAMVELLLSRGANVNQNAEYGQTALCRAVREGFQSITELLLAHKADPNVSDSRNGRTPLHMATEHNGIKFVQMLLAAGARTDAETSTGRTPLSYAAERGSTEIIKLLLAAKADANAGKVDAPLLCSISKRDIASAELLLQAGANPNFAGGIDLPVRPNSADLANQSKHLTPLWLAVYMKQLPMVQLLLKYKADLDDSLTDGKPLLFSALSDTNILEALLNAGAKVDAPDATERIDNNTRPRNRTALQVAVESVPGAVEILLKHGASPNARDANGMTALHYATGLSQNSKVMERLLAYKADPNVRNVNGETPLDLLKRNLHPTGIPGGFPGVNVSEEQSKLANELADLLRRHGALDNLPNWDRIAVSRPAADVSVDIFRRGTNDWNHFTLLEFVFRAYHYNSWDKLIFFDLSRVVIVRPGTNGLAAKRIEINLLTATNSIDFTKDVPLEFGDVVEIPERGHTLAEKDNWYDGGLGQQLARHIGELAGEIRLVVAGGKTIQFSLRNFVPDQSYIGIILKDNLARNVLTSSSDLSRVKVTRRDPKTQKLTEWILDCSEHQPSRSGSLGSGTLVLNSTITFANGNTTVSSPDLLLRDGDIVEVPQKQ